MKLKVRSVIKDDYITKTIYECPCGRGYIEDEQDYTPGFRDGIAFIHCPYCEEKYYLDYGKSETRWEIKPISEKITDYSKGVCDMNLNNVFYFKNIVDAIYPDENRDAVDIQKVVARVKENIKSLSDNDFSEVMIYCFIPDLYSGMGKKEKLFTKLTELMVGEWWRRMGGSYNLPTKKSGTEDVELIYKNESIACDAKVFRLGRSQKAPNVKDFLKLASVQLWIKNLNQSYADKGIKRHAIGGLVTYSSLHEWESNSEVYTECTNQNTHVVMLPYEVLALLLKYKNQFDVQKFLNIWDYNGNYVATSSNKNKYWSYIKKSICNVISISASTYENEIKQYHSNILLAVKEYRKIIQDTVDTARKAISKDMDRFKDIENLKNYAIDEIEKRDNATALDYLKHIDDFRTYRE